MTHERRDWEERQLEVLKQEIAERLRSVCVQVPDEELNRLVEFCENERSRQARGTSRPIAQPTIRCS